MHKYILLWVAIMEEGRTFGEVVSSYTCYFLSKEEHLSWRLLFLSILYSYSILLYIVQAMKGQRLSFFVRLIEHQNLVDYFLCPFDCVFPSREIETGCQHQVPMVVEFLCQVMTISIPFSSIRLYLQVLLSKLLDLCSSYIL